MQIYLMSHSRFNTGAHSIDKRIGPTANYEFENILEWREEWIVWWGLNQPLKYIIRMANLSICQASKQMRLCGIVIHWFLSRGHDRKWECGQTPQNIWAGTQHSGESSGLVLIQNTNARLISTDRPKIIRTEIEHDGAFARTHLFTCAVARVFMMVAHWPQS